MNCLFCQKELTEFQEHWDYEWDCLDSRIYSCESCNTDFQQKVIYNQVFTNEKKSDWRWEDSGKEELTHYRMTLERYEIECFVLSEGPFVVRQWDENHKFIWQVLKLPFMPDINHIDNLAERIKTWILFS